MPSVEDWTQTALRRVEVGRVLTVFAQDVPEAREQLLLGLSQCAPLPAVVTLSWEAAPNLRREIDQMLDALAEAALQLWPRWHATVEERFDREHWPTAAAELHLAQASKTCPEVSPAWLRAAWKKCEKGKPPRLKRVVAAEQVRQLALAIDPSRPYVVLSVENDEADAAQMKQLAGAAEWLAANAEARAFLLVPSSWSGAAELDHVTYRSLAWPAQTLSDAPPAPRSSRQPGRPTVHVHPTLGVPHPGSEAEKKLARFLERDEELAPLFRWNQLMRGVGHGNYTVDALWPEAKLVLELDGGDHRTVSKYAADRVRDYHLLLGGYLTLRLTNEAVLADTELTVERIRNVVRYCRAEGRVS